MLWSTSDTECMHDLLIGPWNSYWRTGCRTFSPFYSKQYERETIPRKLDQQVSWKILIRDSAVKLRVSGRPPSTLLTSVLRTLRCWYQQPRGPCSEWIIRSFHYIKPSGIARHTCTRCPDWLRFSPGISHCHSNRRVFLCWGVSDNLFW